MPRYLIRLMVEAWAPLLDSSECREAEERCGGLVVSGSDGSAILQHVEHALDAMRLWIDKHVSGKFISV